MPCGASASQWTHLPSSKATTVQKTLLTLAAIAAATACAFGSGAEAEAEAESGGGALAEIGRRLGYNIEMLTVSTASRIPALASGRADVVFWIQFFNDMEKQPDVPSEIIVSEPYYSWDIFLKIKKK